MSPNPIDDEELYDVLILGGLASPGKVTLSGHDRKIGWDVKKGPGQSGASMTRTSEDPVSFTATIDLADQDDFDAWDEYKALIDATVSGKTPKALDCYHPDLAEQGIKSVVKDTTQGTQHDGMGGQRKVVKLIEYKPPKPAGGTPSGSNSKANALDPNQDLLDKIAGLENEFKRTNWDGTKNPDVK